MKLNIDKIAFKESLTDTVIATPLSLAINFAMISVAFWLELTATETTMFITSVMFVYAVIRKYFVRIYYKSRYE